MEDEDTLHEHLFSEKKISAIIAAILHWKLNFLPKMIQSCSLFPSIGYSLIVKIE